MFEKHCESCEVKVNRQYCYLCAVAHNAHDKVRPLLDSYHRDEFDIMVRSFAKLPEIQKKAAFDAGYAKAHDDLREFARLKEKQKEPQTFFLE